MAPRVCLINELHQVNRPLRWHALLKLFSKPKLGYASAWLRQDKQGVEWHSSSYSIFKLQTKVVALILLEFSKKKEKFEITIQVN